MVSIMEKVMVLTTEISKAVIRPNVSTDGK